MGDFSKFFDKLQHKYLKDKLKAVIGVESLDVADYGAYIDVENSDGMFKALVENNFVELTGRALDCGYVKFPEVIFKEEFLKEYDPDNFEEYEAFVEAYKIATNRV